jgi:hypothetical protein
VIEKEVSAWVTLVHAVLNYCLAAAAVPEDIRAQQLHRGAREEFVQTGQLLQRLTPSQIDSLYGSIRNPFDHEDIRRAIRALEREPAPSTRSLLLWTLAGIGAAPRLTARRAAAVAGTTSGTPSYC